VRSNSFYLNRTLCDVLEEMCKFVQTLNFTSLMSGIEDAQIMGNQMESGLEDKKDLVRINEEWYDLRAKVMELRKEVPNISGRDGEES
jgi:hypothetical protein